MGSCEEVEDEGEGVGGGSEEWGGGFGLVVDVRCEGRGVGYVYS